MIYCKNTEFFILNDSEEDEMGKNPFHSLSAKFTQLFLDGQADQTPLQPETKEDTYQFISAGSFHTAAITKDGTLYTWGCNQKNQIGPPTIILNLPNTKNMSEEQKEAIRNEFYRNGTVARNEPETWPKQPLYECAAAVSAGNFHSTKLTSDGNAFAWGNNQCGQLGDGTNNATTLPCQIIRACETEVLNEIRKEDQYILNLATKNNTDTPKYCTIYVVIQRSDDSLKSCEVAYVELPANGRRRTEIKLSFPFEPGDIYKIATEYRNA